MKLRQNLTSNFQVTDNLLSKNTAMAFKVKDQRSRSNDIEILITFTLHRNICFTPSIKYQLFLSGILRFCTNRQTHRHRHTPPKTIPALLRITVVHKTPYTKLQRSWKTNQSGWIKTGMQIIDLKPDLLQLHSKLCILYRQAIPDDGCGIVECI